MRSGRTRFFWLLIRTSSVAQHHLSSNCSDLFAVEVVSKSFWPCRCLCVGVDVGVGVGVGVGVSVGVSVGVGVNVVVGA